MSNPEAPPERLTAEELSQFYKAFLDDNAKLHAEYNR